jgi:hypothetical protein
VLKAEIVILQKLLTIILCNSYLLVLEMSVLGLDGVKLVSKGEEVLVALLDLKDLGLKLGNEEVLLVGSEVH